MICCTTSWVTELVHWYNHEHRHSAIGFVTPEQRHAQMDISLLQACDKIYAAARKVNPNRWPGPTRDWSRINEVHLNPQTSDKKKPFTTKIGLSIKLFASTVLTTTQGAPRRRAKLGHGGATRSRRRGGPAHQLVTK